MALPDYTKDLLYDPAGLQRLKDSYLKGEKSPQDRLVKLCNFFGTDDPHRKRLYSYVSNHWLSLSSPILSFNPEDRYSFPISCYLCFLPDNLPAIISTLSEVNNLSVCGGGVSVKVGLRAQSEKSLGVIPHIKTYDACMLAYKQGSRRGSYAMYLDIDHPEIIPFLELRKPTGDYNMRCLNIHHAVNISDKFMKIIEASTYDSTVNDDWELIDPHTKTVKEVVSARYLWQKIIETRIQTGEPFLCFIDTCNKFMNPLQKEKGFVINQSNLCTEIIVPTNAERSSLCCLASVNMEYYDDWEGNETFIGDVMEMLDNVLNCFIEKASGNPLFDRILQSAINEKNIGIGLMGFHSYLQQKMVSIESEAAREINIEVFSWLKKTTDKYNKILGALRGVPSDIAGSGNRFAYTLAIAPTATTSIIMGNTSPSIEPYKANAYRQDTLSGALSNKNKHLMRLFEKKGFPIKLQEKLWRDIITHNGSVQHFYDHFMSKEEKAVFKTFLEIDQLALIQLAADRQEFIDQGQSISICVDSNRHVKDVHKIHLEAWKKGLKTLYYCRCTKVSEVDKLAEETKFIGCESCSS